MITIIIPIFSIEDRFKIATNDQILDYTDKVFQYAISFYKKYIGIQEKDYEFFLTIGSFKVEINFGLLKEETEITNQLNKAEIPIMRFFIEKNILSLVNEMYKNQVEILSLTETLGGYTLLIKDPFNNVIQIECEDFEDENIEQINTSQWNFYIRM